MILKKLNNFLWRTSSNVFGGIAKFFGIVIKTAFLVCRWDARGKKYFLRKNFSLIFFSDFEQTSFEILARKLAGVSIIYFTCPFKNLEELFSEQKLFGYNFLSSPSAMVFRVLSRKISQDCQNCILGVRRISLRKKSSFESERIFWSFSNFELKFTRSSFKNV